MSVFLNNNFSRDRSFLATTITPEHFSQGLSDPHYPIVLCFSFPPLKGLTCPAVNCQGPLQGPCCLWQYQDSSSPSADSCPLNSSAAPTTAWTVLVLPGIRFQEQHSFSLFFEWHWAHQDCSEGDTRVTARGGGGEQSSIGPLRAWTATSSTPCPARIPRTDCSSYRG